MCDVSRRRRAVGSSVVVWLGTDYYIAMDNDKFQDSTN
jgi:hypothetical protein